MNLLSKPPLHHRNNRMRVDKPEQQPKLYISEQSEEVTKEPKKPMQNYHIIRNGGDSFVILNPPNHKETVIEKKSEPRHKGKLLREREV